MPLQVGLAPTIPTPAGNTAPPLVADIPNATWIDPFGNPIPLMNLRQGWFTTEGIAGLGAVPLTFTTDAQEDGGVTVRNIYKGARVITWPMYVEGRTHAEFLARWRGLGYSITSTTRYGPGTLVIARPDGSRRQIRAYYQDGFEGDPTGGIRWDIMTLVLLCPDPYFVDPEPSSIERLYSVSGGSFLSHFPHVSRSGGFGRRTVRNAGDVEAWVDWKVTGPLRSVTVTNERRGKAWTLDVYGYRGSALGDGETVLITSKPPTVLGPDGATSWWGALTDDSELWQLDDGITTLNFEIDSGGDGAGIVGTYSGRHELA